MSVFTKNIPGDFNNEDRFPIWQFSFTRETVISLAIGAGFSALLYKTFSLFGFGKIGLIIGLVSTIVITVLISQKVSESEYLKGSGVRYIMILLRILRRKKLKVVYIKAYKKTN